MTSEVLLAWYLDHKRDLPWRETKDPYKVWLSEVMLQQTRVAQALSYYLKFIEHFPTVKHLADAEEELVLKLWQGLGYYSRARNLHKCAKLVSTQYHGVFPNTYVELLQLPGVGKYTAAAIASFCFNEKVPVVDGNVYRVLARLFGVEMPINSNNAYSYFSDLALDFMENAPANIFNQAIMEFGAIQCTPKAAKCETCCFKLTCVARQNNSVYTLPVKIKQKAKTQRNLKYKVLLSNSHILVRKRTEKGVWQNMYDFPEDFHCAEDSIAEYGPIKHLLSHIEFAAYFTIYKVPNLDLIASENENLAVVGLQELKDLPVSRLVENFIDEKLDSFL
ncbi:MAG: A/G-specific adenine glycosylase [Luteibaculaceae bacterium]